MENLFRKKVITEECMQYYSNAVRHVGILINLSI
jgi:hypothetical protein